MNVDLFFNSYIISFRFLRDIALIFSSSLEIFSKIYFSTFSVVKSNGVWGLRGIFCSLSSIVYPLFSRSRIFSFWMLILFWSITSSRLLGRISNSFFCSEYVGTSNIYEVSSVCCLLLYWLKRYIEYVSNDPNIRSIGIHINMTLLMFLLIFLL